MPFPKAVFMQHVLKHYLKRLTNLSSSNRSLLLLGLPVGQFIDLHDLDFLTGKPSFSIIEQLISGKNSIHLCDVHDSRFDRVNEASNKLKKLDRTEQFIEDERGAHDLYVGYPMIRGKLSDGSPIRCPLLFFPVSLHMQNNRWLLQQREEEDITLNKSFLLAYAYYNKVTIADEWIETSFEDFDKDSRTFRTQVYELLKNSPVEINFNQDNITTNTLYAFEKFSKPAFEEQERTGELKLFPEAVLGIFPQAGSYLVPDYETLLQRNQTLSLEELFLEKQLSPDTLPATREENTFTPFAMDASQENAIKTVKSGKSLVIQGPPGTGKSQLICNLIADYMARGNKVLLVCQKRVALDVVYDRLKEGGMQDFVALVHDFKHDRKALYTQLSTQIEKLDAYKEQNHSLDAIFLERTFLQECRKIDNLTSELEEFRKALFDHSVCGLSVKELYLSSDPLLPHIPLPDSCKHFPFTSLDSFLQKLTYYEAYARQLEKKEYVWKHRVSFAHFTNADLNIIQEVIRSVPVFQQAASSRMESITGERLSLENIETYTPVVAQLQHFLERVQNQQTWEVFTQLPANYHPKATNIAWLQEAEDRLLGYWKGVGIEQSLPTDELADFSTTLAEVRQARTGFFSWLIWQWFSRDKAQVLNVALANGLGLTQEDIEKLGQKVANRIAMEDLLRTLQEIRPVENPHDRAYIIAWFETQKRVVELKDLYAQSAFLKKYPQLLTLPFAQFTEKLTALFSLLQEIQHTRLSWKKYLTGKQLDQILADNRYAYTLISTLQEDFDPLVELDRIKESMPAPEQEVTRQLWEYMEQTATDTSPAPDMVNLFDNSIRIAWIEQIEARYPILRGVSTLKLEQLERELQQSIRKKMQIGRDITLLKAREQTYRNLEYNRLGNLVTYRDLKHQTTKKRNIWQIRKLFTAFAGEIFKLIPCWMASPESVSAIFQMEELFDLVIFDEASQCFAERGIPAIYRARQVVVTGDDKQLPPSDLYRVRFEEETEDTPELEVDSLLDLAAHYFPQTQLQGHYRSQSLELIDFSNQYFYKNTLQLLPDRQQLNKQEPALKYIKVEGIWQDNTNLVEATEVVNLIRTLTSQWPGKELGVVTFNFKQQNLIQDLLEEYALQTGVSFPASLFVKNIENVQGDERDIIIFSVGYAPDTKGRMAMQFGSLNMQGGENRLNVAVTRAREQIYIISSILPPQLKTEDTLHQGPKLLKEYLAYAWHVSGGGYKPSPKPAKGFESSRLLKDTLATQSPHLVKELPFADLTLKKVQQYQSLLLTDDDLYHQSLSAKDAHAYTPFLLSKKNWPFIRVYSREYWKNKTKILEKIADL